MQEIPELYKDAWKGFVEEQLVRLSAYDRKLQEERLTSCTKVCSVNRLQLHEYPNVVGVGVSLKVKENYVHNIPCIVVFVRQKIRPREELPRVIPEKIDGIPTDVVEVGTPVLRHFASHIRPVPPGYSIGHTRVTAGTLGCLVSDKNTRETLILSNNHVIANSNNAAVGDSIVQPGPHDGGSDPRDTIANLVRFKQIVQRGNTVDAAVARPTEPDIVTPSIPGIGVPRKVGRVNRVGISVQKVGRTTQHTRGIVTAYNASIYPLNYLGIESVEFVECIVTTGMSSGGDSGSLLLDLDEQAVGLLFAAMEIAGRDTITYFNDILNVQRELNIDTVTT